MNLIQFNNNPTVQIGTGIEYTLSSKGEKCEFLKFLINTSNFFWQKSDNEILDIEKSKNSVHLLSKLCAIGYLAIGYKDSSFFPAVIIKDADPNSEGRSGKSLLADFLSRLIPCSTIHGNSMRLQKNHISWNGDVITDSTRLVILDGTDQNFEFSSLFSAISGTWIVNRKRHPHIEYPFKRSPKLCVISNHIHPQLGASFVDRQWFIYFSDYYNHSKKPIDSFGRCFFFDWNEEQWLLSWQLLAECIQLYLKFGFIPTGNPLL